MFLHINDYMRNGGLFVSEYNQLLLFVQLFFSQVMSRRSKNIAQTNLLLKHIILTFGAQLGIVWVARTDSFYASTTKGAKKIVKANSLASFLAGYYYSFLKYRNKFAPIIIGTLDDRSLEIPQSLLRLAKTEKIECLLISPIFLKKQVKGTVILGAQNSDNFTNIDFDLLNVLTEWALHLDEMRGANLSLNRVQERVKSFGEMLGGSSRMQEIYKTIAKIAPSDSNVFVSGESGTGKELVARTIHSKSRRSEQAFIPVDCVALPENLLESELFGYEKGAFTGAYNIKRGLMEYANKGTFFFDEITEINVELQAKLLRVLQERQLRRIGGKKLIDIDIRIIAATNQEPGVATANRKLREDLFYRLNVIPIHLPPLRERKEDIPLLVHHFIKELSKTSERKDFDITEEAVQCLSNYNWPGNVRELRNLIERLIALARNEMISVQDLPYEIINYSASFKTGLKSSYKTLPYNEAKEKNLTKFERSYFSRLIDQCAGNITKVANEAKVSRKTVYNILEKHSLNKFQMVGRPIWPNE